MRNPEDPALSGEELANWRSQQSDEYIRTRKPAVASISTDEADENSTVIVADALIDNPDHAYIDYTAFMSTSDFEFEGDEASTELDNQFVLEKAVRLARFAEKRGVVEI